MALGAHQDVQEKVLAEIREVLLDEDRSFTSSDIQKLVYLECVIKETLRILPVVGNLARRTTEEIKLGKCFIKSIFLTFHWNSFKINYCFRQIYNSKGL